MPLGDGRYSDAGVKNTLFDRSIDERPQADELLPGGIGIVALFLATVALDLGECLRREVVPTQVGSEGPVELVARGVVLLALPILISAPKSVDVLIEIGREALLVAHDGLLDRLCGVEVLGCRFDVVAKVLDRLVVGRRELVKASDLTLVVVPVSGLNEDTRGEEATLSIDGHTNPYGSSTVVASLLRAMDDLYRMSHGKKGFVRPVVQHRHNKSRGGSRPRPPKTTLLRRQRPIWGFTVIVSNSPLPCVESHRAHHFFCCHSSSVSLLNPGITRSSGRDVPVWGFLVEVPLRRPGTLERLVRDD